MEADLAQVAKDAQVDHPVQDVLTLKAYGPLNKARQAYQIGQYQESIAQAKNALLVKPDFAPAYWAMGISYGSMRQWDEAIANLGAALKLDKRYSDARDSLKWAKQGQSAAKKGKSPKLQSPEWN
jgi:tetratricopeptide (TPR) repeat protein